MASNTNETNSLDQLQSPEQIELLDTIDKLRNQGLAEHNISLPQLIVCGDQSSGKSSVLEGLTRLKFPTRDGVCTTFATELILRKDSKVAISCTIVPAGKNRRPSQKDELSKFQRVYSSPEDFNFPALIDDARECMGFGVESASEMFFEDILQIKYSGPDLPSLTIVDLPGIIQHQIKASNGPETVRRLVERYMADEKSIILAVIHAKSDLETQSVLKYVRRHDQSASRTMGIITKPDKIDAGSASEQLFLKLARNESMVLDLGWHVVRNRDYGELEKTDTERDEAERQFFSTGVWASLPRANVAIETLRTKLSRVLLNHIRKELPSLTAAIQNAITATETTLKVLGKPREDSQQQRNFLMGKAARFQSLTSDALRSVYSDPFFAVPDKKTLPPTRLRTVIQNLNIDFMRAMYRKGHQFEIISEASFVGGSDWNTAIAVENYDDIPDPIQVQRSAYIKEIENLVSMSRPSGIASMVNTFVIAEAFRDHSKPWEAIAQKHLNQVCGAVKAYLHESLSSAMDTQTYGALMDELIIPELEKRQRRLDEKLQELLDPYKYREPLIYDPAFDHELYQLRLKRGLNTPLNGSTNGPKKSSSSSSQLLMESPDDNFTCCEILDLMNTYYKKSISVFISNVTVLGIESCLITDLPSLLNPELVLNMDEATLEAIAAEPKEIRDKRTEEKRKLEVLQKGKHILDSQARKSGKNIYSTPARLQRRSSSPSTPVAMRPRTPVAVHVSSQDEVDNLSSSFNKISMTPPAKLAKKNTHLHHRAPLTPPKSPGTTTRPPREMPAWRRNMMATVEDAEDFEL